MSRSPQQRSQRGFTQVELVFVVVGVLLLACLAMVFVVHQRNARETGNLIRCQGNSKLNAMTFRIFANDHDDRFPFQAAGSLGFSNTMWAWEHFQAMSNELGTAKTLMCAADRERLNNITSDLGTGPRSLSSQGNAALSYFVGLDADESNPNAILLGDRNLVTNAGNLQGKVFTASLAQLPAWDERQHGRRGNATLADGSVQRSSNPMLAKLVADTAAAVTNRLLLPLLP